jgi:uncharacterized protein (TIGR03435 family)
MLRHFPFSTTLVLAGIAAAPQMQAQATFEVASIKPNTSGATSMKFPFPSGGRFNGTNVNLKTLITFAYGVQGFMLEGAPGWLSSDRYDITAKAAESNVSIAQVREMLQSLLADRFHLAAHRETKEVPVYTILEAKNGSKLEESRPGSCVDGNMPRPAANQPQPIVCGSFFTGPSSLDVRKMSLTQIASTLSIVLGRTVVDKTGLTGTYDFHLEFAPDETVNLVVGRSAGPDDNDPDRSGPSIFTALQQKLGLRLESQRGPGEVLIIDRIERIPAAN